MYSVAYCAKTDAIQKETRLTISISSFGYKKAANHGQVSLETACVRGTTVYAISVDIRQRFYKESKREEDEVR